MDQVILYDKTFQERLQEYQDVLSGYESLPASGVMKEWSFYLSLTVDKSGWQAIWKIPRQKCENLEIPFPTVVLVLVLDVDFDSLMGLVKVFAVQDDISIPEQHYVQLRHLWPTKEQDPSAKINLVTTSNALDMLRFFYINIFLPWDWEDDDSKDWKGAHLESRLRLYYDMVQHKIPSGMIAHINALLLEANRIYNKKQEIEENLTDEDEATVHQEMEHSENVKKLLELHCRLLEIRNEFEMLENPLLRSGMNERFKKVAINQNTEPKIWMIFKEGNLDQSISFLQDAKQCYGESSMVKFASDLERSLEAGSSSDIFCLNDATFSLNSIGCLETGGTLKSLSASRNSIIKTVSENIMFNFITGSSVLENLTIDAQTAQYSIVVRNAKLKMINCKLTGDGVSSIHKGILVLNGGELILDHCDISKFFTGIVGNSGSKITLKNCEVHDVNVGLQVFDGCIVSAQKSTFHDCKDYGIVVEIEDEENERRAGSFDTLTILPHIVTEGLSGTNNVKGDVVINKKGKFKATDLLHCSLLRETQGESDGEMEVSQESNINDTVIERVENVSPQTI